MRIGRLRTRLDLLTPQDVPDGAGGMRRSYAVKAAIWASIRPVRAGPDTTQDREGGSLTHRITVRQPPQSLGLKRKRRRATRR